MDKDIRIVGNSKSIRNLLEFIKISSKTDENILILGDTGVGKELAAINIHLYSHRKEHPFEKINCANLSENLLESELFGHKKGAFSGAVTDKTGLIEEADNGTFFFDEIGDISPFLQAKLLSVIEEKKIRRLGENKYKKINVRFIFATNRDLCDLIDKKKFRKDLYYRICTISFCIPPLKERKEDIPLLAKHIILQSKKNIKKKLTRRALNKLSTYHYPGNIRELENIIKRACIFTKGNKIIEENIIFGGKKEEEKLSTPERLYKEMIDERKIFWEIVHQPFLKREINRDQAKKIISLGLKQTGGSYKKTATLFNINQDRKDYKKFMDVIRIHNLY